MIKIGLLGFDFKAPNKEMCIRDRDYKAETYFAWCNPRGRVRKLQRDLSVSYTHLDVYKRQRLQWLLIRQRRLWEAARWLCLLLRLWSVSYTHLHVYKRQGYTYRYFKRASGSRQHVYGGRCKAEHIQVSNGAPWAVYGKIQHLSLIHI